MSAAGSIVTRHPGVELDRCGCCGGTPPTQTEVFNRPGLGAVAYRIGTQPTFLRAMLSKLAALALDDGAARPLGALSTRSTDDPAIALLDAWATVADVLAFYQERIANEGYLRTATERRSVLELARAIGYELNPGVAASTYLAFSLEDARGAPRRATIDVGTKVQSVPGQNERPQTFETVERIEARAEWNALATQLTMPQEIGAGATTVVVRGTDARLRRGDPLLFVDTVSSQWDLRTVVTIETGALEVRPGLSEPFTTITLDRVIENLAAPGVARTRVYALRARANLFGYMAPDFNSMPIEVKKSYYPTYDSMTTKPTEWPNFGKNTEGNRILDLDSVYPGIVAQSWIVASQPAPTARQVLYRVVGTTVAARAAFTLTAKVTRLTLDADVRTGDGTSHFSRRDALVFGESEELALAAVPTTEYVDDKSIQLAGLVQGLEAGRTVIVSGRRRRAIVTTGGLVLQSDDTVVSLQPGDVLFVTTRPSDAAGGAIAWRLMDRNGAQGATSAAPGAIRLVRAESNDPVLSEIAALAAIHEGEDETTVELAEPLANAYDPASVVVHANVVAATHGETVREVLGGGDGSRPNQRFTLKRTGLTYVSAQTPTGGRSTLTVRVNGVRWDESPSLFGLDPDAQRYTIRIGDDGVAAVLFGDGHSGARPPSGSENIVATYRSGTGPDGEVRAETLTLLQTRPLGVRSVTNPLPATGSAAPERLDAARVNAPLTVLTLERIVSLRDFEDFAHAFGGIGKAHAVAVWEGERHTVHITVAGDGGAAIDRSQPLYQNLVGAIDTARDRQHPVTVTPYSLRTFSLVARVLIDPRYVTAQVVAEVRRALLIAFAFERRDFAQPVTAAEVIGVMQNVSGVLAIDLDSLAVDATANPEAVARQPAPPSPASDAGRPTGRLDWSRIPTLGGTPSSAEPAQIIPEAGAVADTELLLINPRGIELVEVTS